MKRSFFLISVIVWFISFATGFAGDVVMQSRWSDSPIIIDGSPKDWGEHAMAFFKQANVSMGVANDSNYIYFLLNFKDLPQSKFFQRHVAIWLDKTNKNKKNFGIRYAGHTQLPQENMPERNENFQPMPEEFQNRIFVINKKDTLSLKTADDKYGYKVATNYEQGFYCHEIRIPIRQSDSIPYICDATLGKTISVGIELGMSSDEFKGMKPKGGERPDMPEGMGQGGEMHGEAMNRGPGMGWENNPGRGPGGRMEMPKKQEFWLKVALVQNPSSQPEKTKENK